MARRSPELVNVLRRILEAYASGDSDTVRALNAESDALLLIGTDAREWLYGFEAFEVAAAQAADVQPYVPVFRRVEAWEEGTVGWGAADLSAEHAPGISTDYRVTAVFQLERGVWRVVQWHVSVPDTEGIARAQVLPTSLQDLLGRLDADLERSLRSRFSTETVTVLFSDIEDSTALAVRSGDAVWSEMVQSHFSDVQSIAETHNGSVVKTLGDGVMLVFEQAVESVRAARSIQDSVRRRPSPFRVRIGINTGEALAIDGDFFGEAVTIAARVASAASGGETLVTEGTRSHIRNADEATFGDPTVLHLKGIAHPTTVYAVDKR
ncbi:MAG: adenylate/guanylate cyclase domain-containing protein [Acidimicrobiia bacterium]|nr:adenylate/guanylate cyclase domain-containing protein [Acidimicrobiia bacterium]